MMDNNDDLTVAARVKEWDIFAPDWAYLAQFPALELGSLCALSVGLHPAFASPAWVLHVAIPHFNGTDSDELYPLEDVAEGAKRAALLHDFLQRVGIAAGNLAPRGVLPIADGTANAERTVVKVADFVTWARGLGWALPDEFSRPTAAGDYPVAPEGLQVGGGEDKPLSTRERGTLLTIIAAFCKYESWDVQGRGMATTIAKLTEDLGAPVTDDTIRKVLRQIPDALDTRMK